MKERLDQAAAATATAAVAATTRSRAATSAAAPVIRRHSRALWVVPLVLMVSLTIALPVAVSVFGVVVASAAASAKAVEPRPVGCLGSVDVAALTPEQEEHAATIIDVGLSLGVPERGLVVAIATALQESGLRNLDYGDRDSQGLFQQRPVSGWGTVAQIRDPVASSQAFYGRAAHTDNPGLLDIAGWEEMAITEAAQAVQRSAYPFAYAQWEALARATVATALESPDVFADCGPMVNGSWAWPTEGRDTAQFGQCAGYGDRCHSGHDVANTVGTPIWAPADGVVVSVSRHWSYGLHVIIDHGGGVTTLLAHLDSAEVAAGDSVVVGQVVAGMGWSGNVRPAGPGGTHLHYEVRVDGKQVNPKEWHARQEDS